MTSTMDVAGRTDLRVIGPWDGVRCSTSLDVHLEARCNRRSQEKHDGCLVTSPLASLVFLFDVDHTLLDDKLWILTGYPPADGTIDATANLRTVDLATFARGAITA